MLRPNTALISVVLIAPITLTVSGGSRVALAKEKTIGAGGDSSQGAAQRTDGPNNDSGTIKIEMPRKVTDAWKRFSDLNVWEDGLSEMTYYDATCIMYDKKREYVRVHLMNRQFMDDRQWVKATNQTADPVPVFKFVVSEEVPTENYNYRFLTTAFLIRPGLDPSKVSVSSQEWCGHTYKTLLWSRLKELKPSDWALDISCYSYLPDEGDRWWPWPGGGNIDAYECLFVFCRAVVASGGESRTMRLLKSMRSNHGPDPNPIDAVLRIDGKPRAVTVPLGTFEAQRVVLDWDKDATWFDVVTSPPYRLLAFRAGDVKARLRYVERRAYWDGDWKSGFHKPGEAP